MQRLVETASERLELAPGLDGVVLVGRSQECDLRLDDDRVSRVHCCLVPGDSDDCLVVRDLGSLNGTYINGQRLVDQGNLGPGDELQIGQTICRLVCSGDPMPSTDVDDVPAPPTWLMRRRAGRSAPLPDRTVAAPPVVEFDGLPG